MRRMKNSKLIRGIILAAAFAVLPLSIRADDAGSTGSADAKAKPDMLKTCPVSGDKLGDLTFLCIRARRSNFAARIVKRILTRTRPNT